MGDFPSRLIFGCVANVRFHGASSVIVLAVLFVSKNREIFSWKLDSAIPKKGMYVKNVLPLQSDF